MNFLQNLSETSPGLFMASIIGILLLSIVGVFLLYYLLKFIFTEFTLVQTSYFGWRKIEDDITKAWNNNGRKSLSYQFAWKQKLQKIDTGYYQPTKDQEYQYPDFNYNSNAMICKLRLSPYYLDRNKYDLRINFDSIDDDIMYDGAKVFDTFEEGEAQMKIIMKVFEKKFREVYPKGSVYDATFDEMSKYFDMF